MDHLPRPGSFRRLSLTTLLNLSLIWFAQAAGAQWSVATFGDHGELYELRIDAYEDLFPEGADGIDAEHRVMAIDVTVATGDTTRFLVPGTEGPERENRPSLVYDSGQLFVLWASAGNLSSSTLRLIGFDGEVFTSPMEISGSVQNLMGPPRLALTRDSYGPKSLAITRTTLHLVWWEDQGDRVSVFYTPIVLVDGDFLGWNPVLGLARFDRNEPLETPVDASEIFRAVTIEPGADDRSVVVALPQQGTGRLLTLEIRLLPFALQQLADDARAHIAGVGRTGGLRRESASLAGDIVDAINGSEARLHAGVLSYIAQRAAEAILEHGALDPSDYEALADQLYETILDSGASILGNTLRSEDLPCERLHLGDGPEAPLPTRHQVELCLASDRPLPETDPFAAHFVYVSEDGADVLIAWLGPDAEILYRRSEGDGWSDVVELISGDTVSIEQALSLLERQVRLD